MVSLIRDILKNNLALFIRNNLNIKPSGYRYFKEDLISVSDFFYWNTLEKNNTKINITNLASQVLPNIDQDCQVQFIFYDSNGNIIYEFKKNLAYFKSYSFLVSDFCPNNFGSMLIFHNFNNTDELVNHGSYVSEKGYVGYNYDNGPWNFVHGNNSCLSIASNGSIIPLLSKSLFKNNSYIPQVKFDDCVNSSLIFNNSLDSDLKTTIQLYDNNWNKLKTINTLTSSKNTEIISLGNSNHTFVKIISNILLFRPLVLKQYKTYFDIFHG